MYTFCHTILLKINYLANKIMIKHTVVDRQTVRESKQNEQNKKKTGVRRQISISKTSQREN